MAMGTSPAAGTVLSRGIILGALRANRPRILGTLALAQLFVALLLLVSAWPAAHGTAQASSAGFALLSGELQLVCFALSAMLGGMLALMSPAASTSSGPAIAASWPTILARTQEAVSVSTLPVWGPALGTFAPHRERGDKPGSLAPTLTRSALIRNDQTRTQLDFSNALSGLSGTTVARGLADTWIGHWGQHHIGSAFEVDAHRGRIQCSPTVLRQCVIHLLTAAAVDQPLGGPWQISVHTQQGERVATLHGRSSASQAEQVRAQNIDALFALTLAEALIWLQGGSLSCNRIKGGHWSATISLPHC
jgi:hypothetical protein